ncbi:hypothetical protein MA16_Dca029079 [Dendrobium catenatum]|uniref:Uncharacterized protein n=1 Tax=Dendrobium catenatum TaxID=906689 RepID=A0A2I0VGN1_9ASPA|nr:hypothetical protein MA16_Dca029079 [Dendrobium catenatum]
MNFLIPVFLFFYFICINCEEWYRSREQKDKELMTSAASIQPGRGATSGTTGS